MVSTDMQHHRSSCSNSFPSHRKITREGLEDFQTYRSFRASHSRSKSLSDGQHSEVVDINELVFEDIDHFNPLDLLPFKDCDDEEFNDIFKITNKSNVAPATLFSVETVEQDTYIALQHEVATAEGFIRPQSQVGDWQEDTEISSKKITCYICFDEFSDLILFCNNCELHICYGCMSSHIEAKILEGVVQISCAGDSCAKTLSDQMISAFAPDAVGVYMKNKVELENDPNKKTCPSCHKVEMRLNAEGGKGKIKCSVCKTVWCFQCHAPWHWNMTCGRFQKDVQGPGKKALKYWAKSNNKASSSNARRCPNCKFFIERISGCDHMNCMKCHTDFCYRCGKKHRSMGWFGDHYSTYSFLGCKYNLTPDKPLLRNSIRGGIICGWIVFGPVVASVGITVAVCASPYIIGKIIKKRCC